MFTVLYIYFDLQQAIIIATSLNQERRDKVTGHNGHLTLQQVKEGSMEINRRRTGFIRTDHGRQVCRRTHIKPDNYM
jgi:hypothetical protein